MTKKTQIATENEQVSKLTDFSRFFATFVKFSGDFVNQKAETNRNERTSCAIVLFEK